ncbi:MAG: cobalt-precorrin 5A hydrolase [Leptospirillum sp.]|jgi:cobalt-precorrin 5A hydrolase
MESIPVQTTAKEKIAIITITRPGLEKAAALLKGLDATLYVSERYAGEAPEGAVIFDGVVKNLLPGLFDSYDGIILVMALGIVVRTIAPLIVDKKKDPGIVVIDVTGRFAISLLSGHLGGANALAREAGEILGAIPVITTGTDVRDTIAPDMMAKEIGADLTPFDLLKRVSSAIVDGDRVLVINPEKIPFSQLSGTLKPNILLHGEWPDPLPLARAAIVISSASVPPTDLLPVHVTIHPRILAIGIGCNRGTSAKEIISLVEKTLEKANLSVSSIARFATIDLKKDEEGILETARFFNRPLEIYTREELSQIDSPNPSEVVRSHVGTPGVSEPAALLAIRLHTPFPNGRGELSIEKVKSENATMAVARWVAREAPSGS